MTTPSAALEHEHHAIDDAVEAFANADPAELTDERRTELLQAITLLRHHIYLEEVYLFPPLRAAGLVGPVMVMEHEHGQMWPVLDELESLLADGISDGAGLLCRGLLAQLASHNMKEERILYPQIDELLPAMGTDLPDLLAGAEAPGNWVCAAAG